MDYATMVEKLKGSDAVFYSKDDTGRWCYAKVRITDDGVAQDDFPEEKTAGSGSFFIISLLRDFDDEQDISDTLTHCGLYSGQ